MSARAAARLESLGFTRVYRYKPGKQDWMANGFPAEGSEISQPQAKDIAHKDVPTCHLEEKIKKVQASNSSAGWNACVVVNDEQVVLGLLHLNQLQQADPNASSASLMECGPRTYRMDTSIDKVKEYFQKNHTDEVLVTDADGKLVGIILRADL